MSFITGNKPHNKISSTSEDFIRENYKTMTNPEMGNKLGVHPKSIIRIMNRLGLKRNVEDILNLKLHKQVNPDLPTIESLLDKVTEILIEEDKVPVKVNKDTTVWVKRSKCKQLENGDWEKKTQVNILKNGELQEQDEDSSYRMRVPSDSHYSTKLTD